MRHPYIRTIVDILPGLKALGNNRALAPRWVDISQAAATLAVVLCWPPCPFFVSVGPPATNIFLAAFSSRLCLAPQCTTFPLTQLINLIFYL